MFKITILLRNPIIDSIETLRRFGQALKHERVNYSDGYRACIQRSNGCCPAIINRGYFIVSDEGRKNLMNTQFPNATC